ncbi:MAG: AtpZ/AtpI family protein [Clostridia bacterium]|nr:AtpZ/AtpI family protein [Clostridia bacterium]
MPAAAASSENSPPRRLTSFSVQECMRCEQSAIICVLAPPRSPPPATCMIFIVLPHFAVSYSCHIISERAGGVNHSPGQGDSIVKKFVFLLRGWYNRFVGNGGIILKDNRIWAEIFKNITFLTQVGLSVSLPMVFCIWGSVWLSERYNLGGWVILLGIALGIGSGAANLWKFLKYVERVSKKKEK